MTAATVVCTLILRPASLQRCSIVEKRIQRYLKACLDSATHSNPAAVPAALVPVQKELSRFTAQFLKVSSYNREVFRPHYTNIIDDFTMTID